MNFFTRIDQGSIAFIYSHAAETLYVFPQIHEPRQMTAQKFWSNLIEGKKLADREKIQFSVQQYCC